MARAVCKHTISISADDTDIEKWIQMQRNLSASIRTIIENEIYARGFVDATSVPLKERIQNGQNQTKKTRRSESNETTNNSAASNLLDSLK